MNKILFVDTLTTGMNTERCAIYRIGGIYTEDGVEKKRFDFKVAVPRSQDLRSVTVGRRS